MGSNTEKKPWTNLQNLYKNEAKGLRATTLLSQSWESDNQRGCNREKSNIAIAILDKWIIWTYPISPFTGQAPSMGFTSCGTDFKNSKKSVLECLQGNTFKAFKNRFFKR